MAVRGICGERAFQTHSQYKYGPATPTRAARVTNNCVLASVHIVSRSYPIVLMGCRYEEWQTAGRFRGPQVTELFSDLDGSRLLLEEAERTVTLGERHISRQLEIIGSLRRRGRDAALAEEVLATFRSSQKLHVAERDRLLLQLKSARSSS